MRLLTLVLPPDWSEDQDLDGWTIQALFDISDLECVMRQALMWQYYS